MVEGVRVWVVGRGASHVRLLFLTSDVRLWLSWCHLTRFNSLALPLIRFLPLIKVLIKVDADLRFVGLGVRVQSE